MVIHPSADVNQNASIGPNTRVWHRTQICEGARVGDECIVGSSVYIDRDVVIGNRVKIQTGAQIYHGAVIEDGVFIGPNVCLTNDRYPRAINPDGRLKTDADWVQGEIRVLYGASLGAGAVVIPNVTIGRFALVAAGAVVTASVPDYALVIGVPARLVGYVCSCGHRLRRREMLGPATWECGSCRAEYLYRADGGLRLANGTSYQEDDDEGASGYFGGHRGDPVDQITHAQRRRGKRSLQNGESLRGRDERARRSRRVVFSY